MMELESETKSESEGKTTNPYKPFIKLIAGKPTTKTGNKRKYSWEIKFATDENLTEKDIEEIKKLNNKMIENFGEVNEGIGK